MDQFERDHITSAALQPALVEHFAIEGLFGYRSVSLDSRFAATVLIARNGSGKTTLIAALDAFLRGQFTRFAGLRFSTITCRLKGLDEPLVVDSSDIAALVELTTNSEIVSRAKTWEVEPLALLELLETNFDNTRASSLLENPTFHAIYQKHTFDARSARNQCEKLAALLRDRIPQLGYIREMLRSILGKTEIVYLPTYRRIELSIPTPDSRFGERKKNILARLGVARSGLYTADIQFGLSDISDRLKTLYSEMLSQANQGYGKVSANIINDLISGSYKNTSERSLPPQEALEIFFGRIRDAEREYRRVPYSNYLAMPDLARVYSGDVPEDSKGFLAYFLDQLNSVMRETQDTEKLVADFIESCNKYLAGDDDSTDVYDDEYDLYDRKLLTFNRSNLRVTVNSTVNAQEIPMEALSSGEKQMISLFARLYLYPGPKLVLIDEPELSLSLDWQRQILPDVLTAPNCQQVIAITHSPFIFENALEPFAGSLRLKVSKTSHSDAFTDDLFGEGSVDDL